MLGIVSSLLASVCGRLDAGFEFPFNTKTALKLRFVFSLSLCWVSERKEWEGKCVRELTKGVSRGDDLEDLHQARSDGKLIEEL